MSRSEFGVLGLGVMGENLALNVSSNGFRTAVFNRTPERTRRFAERTRETNIAPTYSLDEFIGSLETPKKILLMVKAGEAIDEVLRELQPRLSKGDTIIDGGNSFFRDTERRLRQCQNYGLSFLGVGISGGEEGALKGPCIMAGGPREGYDQVEPILTRVAAKVDGEPCCAYLGPGGAGHFTKMVHNGIEYALLELIAETYDILRNGLGLKMSEIREIFSKWNEGELSSYLIQIASSVLDKMDTETGKPLLDLILDKAGQKGTGRWFSQTALDLGVPTPSIDAAVSTRNLSVLKNERGRASHILQGPKTRTERKTKRTIDALHNALYCSVIVSYAQGLAVLRAASRDLGYGTSLSEVARIWRGGCIIRARVLDDIRRANDREADLPNILLDSRFAASLSKLQDNWRSAVRFAKSSGIPCPTMNASLDYYDAYRRLTLPANLIQAMRDYFGAHRYERVDRPGTFHTEWA